MSNKSSTQQRIKDLQAQIAALKGEELQALQDRRSALARDLFNVESQIAQLTGRPLDRRVGGDKRRPRVALSFADLKERLAVAPSRTLNVRKDGLDLVATRALVEAHPQNLRMGGIGAWPTVTLLK